MEERTLTALVGLAALIGFGHTLVGPDHYVPFIAMSRAGRWSMRRTVLITILCGIGHVLGSIVLGLAGSAVGWSLASLEWFEGVRGGLAGWLLLGFGLAYTAWGLRRAMRGHKHSHQHVHTDGTMHAHEHDHHADHSHVHASDVNGPSLTPWVLFTIFVFGPCEPLIPLLMYPAARHSTMGMLAVAAVFSAATLTTMTLLVAAGRLGAEQLKMPRLERFSHALAGLALVVCALAIQFGL